MIKISRSIVPNFFTVGNMFSGFLSVIVVISNRDLALASWLIVLAAFLDAMDGKVARFTKTSSRFGVEYDSLADVVSFGLAPSILIYAFYFSAWKTVGIFISFFPLLFGSIRLARFNIQLTGLNKSAFSGLPSPAAAILLATYIIFISKYFPGNVFPKILLLLTFVTSTLMISTLNYNVLPNLTFKGDTKQKVLLILLIVAVTSLFFFPQALFFPYCVIYMLSGVFGYLFGKSSNENRKTKKEE
ncbi:MAG: CDP-diacylglycerol--serine O-phosphatidyltransferase [Calditrichaceae bacterium]|nr:CDP-diacylglycerol--serine O-phosphatidyltransferase [Calditrichaceae bacterium]